MQSTQKYIWQKQNFQKEVINHRSLHGILTIPNVPNWFWHKKNVQTSHHIHKISSIIIQIHKHQEIAPLRQFVKHLKGKSQNTWKVEFPIQNPSKLLAFNHKSSKQSLKRKETSRNSKNPNGRKIQTRKFCIIKNKKK